MKKEYFDWYSWFAWYPVKLDNGQYTWLEWIERKPGHPPMYDLTYFYRRKTQ